MVNKSCAALFFICFYLSAEQYVVPAKKIQQKPVSISTQKLTSDPLVLSARHFVTKMTGVSKDSGRTTPPKLVVVFVIDQFAAHYLTKLDGYLHAGIHTLLKNGMVYTNAFYPHAVLETAVGHTSLGTGSLPGYSAGHGIVANNWLTSDGVQHALTGDSADEITAQPLTKYFLLRNEHNRAIALSLKDRAAIGMVGSSAPAVWFDKQRGNFVSSIASELARTALAVGNNYIRTPRQTSWPLTYADERYYQFPFIDNYDYASEPSLFLPSSHNNTASSRDKFLEVFLKLPESNKLLLDMAHAAIVRAQKEIGNDGSLLVWISLSSLDKVGHIYGPFSREAIDTIYHLDRYIGDFIQAISRVVAPQKTLYMLTADHGVMPIPELIQSRFPHARRIIVTDLIDQVNLFIKKKFKISDVIKGHKTPHLYLDWKKLNKLSPERRALVIAAVREKFAEYPGIRYVYDAQKLAQTPAPIGSMAWRFKNNIYPGRSGDLLVQIEPYTIVSKYKTGTKHYTPYAYNTHVPLVLYQPGIHEKTVVTKPVWVNQATATLARVFGVAYTCPFVSLPGVGQS